MVFRKSVVSRLEFIIQALNFHWKSICLTFSDLLTLKKPPLNSVAAEDDEKPAVFCRSVLHHVSDPCKAVRAPRKA